MRAYRNEPLPEEVFLRVMEAARLAPSGKNL
ncbi:MAG: nitroreductase, partial [Candidatus Aminicenantes bacterium]|nr:nitroreductase [Candidatus Aminicenantes bacterium]